jgi:hypothetical protein
MSLFSTGRKRCDNRPLRQKMGPSQRHDILDGALTICCGALVDARVQSISTVPTRLGAVHKYGAPSHKWTAPIPSTSAPRLLNGLKSSPC